MPSISFSFAFLIGIHYDVILKWKLVSQMIISNILITIIFGHNLISIFKTCRLMREHTRMPPNMSYEAYTYYLHVSNPHGCSTLYLLLLLQYLTPTPPSLRLSPFLPSFPPFSSPEPSNLSRELPATSLVIHDCALPEDFISFYAPHASCRGGGDLP